TAPPRSRACTGRWRGPARRAASRTRASTAAWCRRSSAAPASPSRVRSRPSRGARSRDQATAKRTSHQRSERVPAKRASESSVMPVLSSTIDTRSSAFAERRAQMLALVEQFRELEAKVRAHSAESKGKYDKRGQLLPRERVDRLLDRGSPFLELSTLA